MKKILLFPIFLLSFTNSIFAQNELTETEKLATTAKIWGFLKYYHPEVAKGKYNWDEELFKVLPKAKTATNNVELSQVYFDWIKSLGDIKPCKKCNAKKNSSYFDKNFNLDWLNNNQILSPQVSEKLTYIEKNRHQGEKYYVKYYSNKLKIADFTNEIDYIGFDWRDEHLRLLTLFRYWNQIEYFFPAKYQTDNSWDTILNKMIPKFLYSKSESQFHQAMLELAVSIDDSHVRFQTKQTNSFFGNYLLPVKFKLIEDKAVITGFYNDSLAKLDDLKIGDIITKADDKLIKTLFDEKEEYIIGSNDSRKIFYSRYYILNGTTNSVKLEIIRGNRIITKSVKRYMFNDFNYQEKNELEKYKILENNIGYVNIGAIDDVPKTMEALINTKAIIFDIRKSTASTPYYFASYMTSQRRDFYKAIVPDLDYPGKYQWTKTYQSGTNGKLKYPGKVILLVDENCQSQREFTTMCLQTADSVTTIGCQTSGADGNVVIFNMVGGYKTQISGVGIFYPDGTETQRRGVKIDIAVKQTIEGLANGKDEILERAIEFVNQ